MAHKAGLIVFLLASSALAAPPVVTATSWMNSVPLAQTDLEGRVVLLDFWATWCLPCVRNLPTLQSYADAFKDQPFKVIGVHYSDAPQLALYLRDQDVHFPIAIDTGETFRRFEVARLPTYVLIDKQGTIRSQTNEPPPKEKIAALIAE